jgi:hypothetical protein
MVRACVALVAVILLAAPALGQTPQPFPRPGTPQQNPPPRPSAPAPAPAPAPAAPAAPPPAAAAQTPPAAAADPGAPDAATVYFPLYPTAQFIGSYDAGRGQRYYIYGATAPFADLVTFYRTQLRDRGDQVFVEPPTHMFSIGRFREETMAFPPGVTIKDWTWGGSQGYPNPKAAGGQPARFPSVIMIVPPPVAAPVAAPAAR